MSSEPEPRGDDYPGTPRWVKAFAFAALAIIVVIALVLVIGTSLGVHTPGGPGHHGPIVSPAHSR